MTELPENYFNEPVDRILAPVTLNPERPVPVGSLSDLVLAERINTIADIISEERLPILLPTGATVNLDWLKGRSDCRDTIVFNLRKISEEIALRALREGGLTRSV
jgi:hypothetical protein